MRPSPASCQYFQQLLFRLFPRSDPGHSLIKYGSYILRNINANRYILPSSPGVKMPCELIKPDNRVEMSVIIPYEDADTKICPKCKKKRKSTSSVETTWYVAAFSGSVVARCSKRLDAS
jgi:hypothetical protein